MSPRWAKPKPKPGPNGGGARCSECGRPLKSPWPGGAPVAYITGKGRARAAERQCSRRCMQARLERIQFNPKGGDASAGADNSSSTRTDATEPPGDMSRPGGPEGQDSSGVGTLEKSEAGARKALSRQELLERNPHLQRPSQQPGGETA